ncbi:MAG: CHAT domain-containing protein, partial [Bacteroidota bacterium]
GLLFQKQQKFAAAAAMYQRGLSPIFQNSREPVANVLILRGNRGYNLYQAGDFAAAEREIRATIQDWLNADLSQETVSRYLAFCYGYLMMPLRTSKQYEQIDQTLAQGLHHARSISPNGKGRALGTLYTYAAMAAADQHDFSRADSLFQLATYSLTDNSELSGPAQLPGIAGNLFYGQEEIMELLEARRQAYRQSFAAGHQEGLENALLVSYKIDTLLRQSRQQLSLTASLEQFIDQEKRHYVTAVDLALQLYRNTDEDRYLRTAFHFASNQKSNLLRQYLMVPKLAENFGLPAELIAEQTELELQVLTTEKALLSANKADVLTLQRKLLGLNHTLGAMRKDIATSYPAYALALRGYPPVNVAEALSSLAEDQLVVEYFLSQDSIYAFTLAKADGLGYLVFARPESLPAMVQEVVDGGAAAGAMYDQLLASIIPEEGITRLQIIPDGILWQLPFAALRTPDNRFLIEKVAVSYAYSSSLLFDESLAQSYERKKDKYQGYGIDYLRLLKRISSPGERSAEVNRLRDIGHLPFATKEVATAAKIIGGRALLNEEATKTRFLAEAPTANIIHVSMHGLLAENPLESALVFRSEDDTKAYELLYMKEVLGTQFPVALAVLSACHTGNGSLQASEGMQSLGRAFTAAGSSSTIASSWEAKDEATHRILTDFYRHLRTGAPKDVALQSSIITFLQDGTPADRRPENWANLTLTGSIAAVSGRTPTWWILIGGLIVLGGGMWFYNRKSRPI